MRRPEKTTKVIKIRQQRNAGTWVRDQLEKEETQRYRKKYFNRGGKSEFIENEIDRKQMKGKESTINDTKKDFNVQDAGIKSARTIIKNDPDDELHLSG